MATKDHLSASLRGILAEDMERRNSRRTRETNEIRRETNEIHETHSAKEQSHRPHRSRDGRRGASTSEHNSCGMWASSLIHRFHGCPKNPWLNVWKCLKYVSSWKSLKVCGCLFDSFCATSKNIPSGGIRCNARANQEVLYIPESQKANSQSPAKPLRNTSAFPKVCK